MHRQELTILLLLSAGCNVYRSDVGKLCDAERLSEASFKTGRAQVFAWMERNVASSEAVIMVREIESKDAHGIAASLHDEARKVGLGACTFADQVELQAKDDDFRSDLANLCAGSAARSDGSIARLEILSVDDAERVREIADWTHTNAKSSDTDAIVAKLAAAPVKQRGAMLRAEAAKVGVTQCLMASTLESPPPQAAPVDIRTVNPSFVVHKVDGPVKSQAPIAQAIIGPTLGAAINGCYAVALSVTPTLAGKMILKLQLDVTGHVAAATAESTAVKGPIVQCVGAALAGATVPGPAAEGGKKGTKADVVIELIPVTGPGYTATIDQAWLGKVPVPKRR